MRYDKSAGLTLIELLVALSITTIILAIAGTSLSSSLRAWQSENRAVENVRTRAASVGILREQVENALPIREIHSAAGEIQQTLAFDGDSRQLHLISRSSFSSGTNSFPRWIQISWQNSRSDGPALVVEERKLGADNLPAGDPLWKQPIMPATDFKLEYLTRPQNGTQEWVSSWNGADRHVLPAAVRIQFTSDRHPREQFVIKLAYSDSNAQGFWLP